VARRFTPRLDAAIVSVVPRMRQRSIHARRFPPIYAADPDADQSSMASGKSPGRLRWRICRSVDSCTRSSALRKDDAGQVRPLRLGFVATLVV